MPGNAKSGTDGFNHSQFESPRYRADDILGQRLAGIWREAVAGRVEVFRASHCKRKTKADRPVSGDLPQRARAEAKRLQAELTLGILRVPQKVVSFSEILEIYYDTHSKQHHRPYTAYQTKRILNNHFRHSLGTKDIAGIKAGDIAKILDGLHSAPSEAEHAFRTVRAFFNYCVKRGYVETSPMSRLESPKKGKSRVRVLSDEELAAVWSKAQSIGYPYGTIVRLLILTGQRCGEIAALQWDWIDMEARTITLPSVITKNGRQHVFPFGELTHSVLASVTRSGALLFPARGYEDRAFKGFGVSKIALDKSGVKNFTHHDLRRTYATNMAADSVPIHVLEKLLNHSSGELRGVAAIYNRHTYSQEMRDAVTRWEARVPIIISTEPFHMNTANETPAAIN